MKDVKLDKPHRDIVYAEDINLDEDLVFFRKDELIYTLCKASDGKYKWITGNDHIWGRASDEVLDNAILFAYEEGANIKCINSSELEEFKY